MDDSHAQLFRPLAFVLARHFVLAMHRQFSRYAVAADFVDEACIAFVAAGQSCSEMAVDVVAFDDATFAMIVLEYEVIECSKRCHRIQGVALKK